MLLANKGSSSSKRSRRLAGSPHPFRRRTGADRREDMPLECTLSVDAEIPSEHLVSSVAREQQRGSVLLAAARHRDGKRSLGPTNRSAIDDEGVAQPHPALRRGNQHRCHPQHIAQGAKVRAIVSLSRKTQVEGVDALSGLLRDGNSDRQEHAGVEPPAHQHAHVVDSLEKARDRRENTFSQLVGNLLDCTLRRDEISNETPYRACSPCGPTRTTLAGGARWIP